MNDIHIDFLLLCFPSIITNQNRHQASMGYKLPLIAHFSLN